MLIYRRIDDDPRWPEYIWRVEQTFPAWFKAASEAWVKDLPAFQVFWERDCDEVWGLFDIDRPDDLLACIYLEYVDAITVNIHVSVLAPVDERELARFFRSLKSLKAAAGVRRMIGYVLGRNKALLAVAEAAQFSPTGLRMSYGTYRGRSFEWLEVRG